MTTRSAFARVAQRLGPRTIFVAAVLLLLAFAWRFGRTPSQRIENLITEGLWLPPLAVFLAGLPDPDDRPGAPPPTMSPLPRLVLENLAGERLFDVAPFDAEGYPRPEAWAAIDRTFRARGGHKVEIHPRLIEVLMTISRAFEDRPIALVSGHRVPGRGTRQTSYHVRGMAADIAIRGVKIRALRKAAIRLGAWGVGIYPKFVHVDVRSDRPYRWVGGRWPRRRR